MGLLFPFVQLDETSLTRSTTTGILSVKDLGISTAKLAALAVTRPKQAAVGEQRSASSGGLSSSSASYIDVGSVTITTTGRPVCIGLFADDTAANAYIQGGAGGVVLSLKVIRGATDLGVGLQSGAGNNAEPPGVLKVDTPAAGTYTYKVQMKSSSGGVAVTVNNCIVVAWEM